jgi:hypothetical protein
MLHTAAVDPGTLAILKRLMARPELRQFNLVGGTALALQIGHRESIDLDLFTVDDFDAYIQDCKLNGSAFNDIRSKRSLKQSA